MATSDFIYDPLLLNFYRSVAEHLRLLSGDVDFIFDIPAVSVTRLGESPTELMFHLQDTYPVNLAHRLTGNALALSAEGQRNKTTSLLAMATLLGYSWSDRQNVEFLEDDECVQKGLVFRQC
jgi:hypothetical protein